MPDVVGASSVYGDKVSDIGYLLELIQSRPAWHAAAACREAPAEVTWFPEMGGDARAARAVCAGCPVASECLAWALDQGNDLPGVWAGLTGRERTRMRRRPAA